jgi:cell wall-associated NlpC family hydrolase
MQHRFLLLIALALPAPLLGQGPGFQLGHLFTDPSATSYRLGTTTRLTGPLGAGAHAVVIDGRQQMGNLWGLGVDLSLFRSGGPGVYALGGVEGGVITKGSDTFWGSWSAGVGYEVFPLRGLSLAAEGRYRVINPGHFDGVEVGLRLGLDRGSRSKPAEDPAPAASATSLRTIAPVTDAAPEAETIRADLGSRGVAAERATLISGVVQTALDVMGMPYRWGDEGEQGFDCSGLIRYAFGKHGVTLPRASRDQAREGEEIERDLDALQAGDVLTFAIRGSRISHVGLYLGNGRFIHSARKGVQISVLSPDDISGRWWYKRWKGARRVV